MGVEKILTVASFTCNDGEFRPQIGDSKFARVKEAHEPSAGRVGDLRIQPDIVGHFEIRELTAESALE